LIGATGTTFYPFLLEKKRRNIARKDKMLFPTFYPFLLEKKRRNIARKVMINPFCKKKKEFCL